MRPARTIPVLAVFALLAGCGDDAPHAAQAVYEVPASWDDLVETHFFDHPWPSDLRLENGSPRIKGYPNPRHIVILDDYLTEMAGVLDGFSPVGAGYLRFDSPIDPASLPGPKGALSSSASVQLVDVDPASPDHGQRRLVSLEWRSDTGVYWQSNTLAFMPTVGFPLRPHTRYALVVTDALKSADGTPVKRAPNVDQALGLASASTPAMQAAATALAPAVAELATAGVAKDHVVHLAVFTTSNPTKDLFAVSDVLAEQVPPPTAETTKWKLNASNSDYDEYLGVYGPSPNYQAGKIPFSQAGDGGRLNFIDGKPALVDTFTLRFSLTVPSAEKCPMPALGYPIVLYAHGTGGNFRSYQWDGTGRALAKRCLATMGIDGIWHGKRPGAPPDENETTEEILFYNFQNIEAARTNGEQAAIDELQRARLFTDTHLFVPGFISKTKANINFDADKLMFFGHSQGGLNAPLFLATSDTPRGGVFSGSGAIISIALNAKSKPEPSIAELVRTLFLGLKYSEVDEVDVFHPWLSLAQSFVDCEDPINYANFIVTEPREGHAPKSVYLTEGINPDGTGDSYAPPHGIEAHGVAIGLPPQLPMQRPIVELSYGGTQPVTVPADGLSGNLGDGEASGVLAQWPVPPGDDGHFVVFDVPEAKAQAAEFLKNLAANTKGRVPPP